MLKHVIKVQRKQDGGIMVSLLIHTEAEAVEGGTSNAVTSCCQTSKNSVSLKRKIH